VRVRVTDSEGATALSDPVTITATNRPPVVSAASWVPAEPDDGEEVSFVLTAFDPDGTIAGWVWDLELDSEPEATGTTPEFAHVFQDDGSYVLSVRVRDDDGTVSAPFTTAVVVDNASPIATFTAVQGSACGIASVRFDATQSYDPSPEGSIVHVGWDFGDGTSCPGTSVGCGNGDRWTPEHCYSAPGAYIVTLVVIDEQGSMSRVQKTILISE
jgi:PKD repeat protein